MSDVIQVSPNFQLDRKTWKIISLCSGEGSSEYNFDDKTAARLIYQDRMEGWFFKSAYELIKMNQVVVAVHVVTPLIEALENYIRGKSSRSNLATLFFKSRAKQIFSSLDDNEIELLYKGVRCGFAHEGFVKDDTNTYNILISSEKADMPIKYQHPEMTIYASQYVAAIENEFKNYYSRLESESETLDDFFKVWKNQWAIKRNTVIEIAGVV